MVFGCHVAIEPKKTKTSFRITPVTSAEHLRVKDDNG
jgi:hypothetical protein